MKTTLENKEFDELEYLKYQMKYLGFGENEKLYKDLEIGINSHEKQFHINALSDKTLLENTVNITLEFRKSDQGKVFINSYHGELINEKGSRISHHFPVHKEDSYTVKEAINLLEGRSVKIELLNPKSGENEPVFTKLNFVEPKTEKDNYQFQNFYKNYGIYTRQIVERAHLVFDKPEHKENAIKSLEKGNIVNVKFELKDRVVEGKAVLNPQYKNINLYDQDMNRINTNKPLLGLDVDNKHQKSNIKEHNISRSI
ncbi:hypothetical protein [Chryseobacterium potabilaquae]|uniref:DUF3945 domain-containing protein n=1 Tax=Chryseobacterium potabilaquae TaxID=2675057 RepID=A0A6N4X895_9FLAO|nr:hypothetical protein [Chryseobacterium potabilaquae]CAA7196988.1 hypothetical protein CHRY9293_03046 [Chryseobacterium potabilaquae]